MDRFPLRRLSVPNQRSTRRVLVLRERPRLSRRHPPRGRRALLGPPRKVSGSMRRLHQINDYPDIYQPVSDEDIQEVESRLGLAFLEGYKRFVRDPDIEVIKRLPSLLWFVRHESVGILDVNHF